MTSSKLTDKNELLFRQVHPSFMQGDDLSSQPFMPTSAAFTPTQKDEGKLSVDRASITTARASFELFARNGHASAAVFGLTVEEFGSLDIACHSDPIAASDKSEGNAAHALADYNPYSANQQKTKAKRLKQSAIARGKLHP